MGLCFSSSPLDIVHRERIDHCLQLSLTEGLESSLGWSSLAGVSEAFVARFAQEGVAPKQIRSSYGLLPERLKDSRDLQYRRGASMWFAFQDGHGREDFCSWRAK